ncbi:type II toxin-antitoxin system CcdA family antitoxin [Albimonas sp. CAU 1670]|uniref:type II toxin-antitoxin system CcdA family antitoxin n=1 Tax=Albimonas sp. CAU 1670 TaxID=3032599 RepID=UPI0023DA0700|nr:type II toxin-antitoxin system CcdA family antitoxin [Albimonas sp. CAU 1670]MDF2233203.1 type II toxin-antitoxin system CcdA family antitoxin [Albimonas sp. CAU 1670]
MTEPRYDDDRDLPAPKHPARVLDSTALRPAEASEPSREQDAAGAIADYNSFIEANGLPLARYRKF